MLRRLVRWLQPAFLLLAVIAIGWFLANQWPVLRSYPWRLHWGWLLATCVITLASWALEIAIWRHLIVALGGILPYWAAARIWFLSALVRYVPGNIWQPISLTLYSRRHGVLPEVTITSIVLFQVVMLLATAPILVAYFVWIDAKSLAAQFVAAFPPLLLWLAMIPVLAFLLRPQWLVQLINWALARLQRPPLAMQLTSGSLFLLIVVSLLDWLLWGGVFAAFTFAVAGEGIRASAGSEAAIAPLLVASYPIANLIGFLALITPSGFGVREGAFYLLLTPHIAGSVVTVIALGVRVWGLLNELLFAFISMPFERAAQHRRAQPSPLDELAKARDLAIAEPGIGADISRAGRREIT
jgi:hypothetical protein